MLIIGTDAVPSAIQLGPRILYASTSLHAASRGKQLRENEIYAWPTSYDFRDKILNLFTNS